jgi:hypothetical protein
VAAYKHIAFLWCTHDYPNNNNNNDYDEIWGCHSSEDVDVVLLGPCDVITQKTIINDYDDYGNSSNNSKKWYNNNTENKTQWFVETKYCAQNLPTLNK